MGSKSNKGQLAETEQEKALAEVAVQAHMRYKNDWLPLQKRAIEITQGLNKPDSWERERARGRAAEAGTEIDSVAEDVEKGDFNRGIDAGSGNFIMRQAALGTERAKGVGIATGDAETSMDDAYVQGLASIVKAGRQQSDIALEGMGRSAQTATKNAQAGAYRGAANRAGNAELAGTVIGAGVQAGRGINWGGNYANTGGSTFENAGEAAPGDRVAPFRGRFGT